MALSSYANEWDQQKRISEKILTEWVQDNPQWWAVGIAATVQTAMDMGAGMVDVLRFGEGAAKGGITGYGQDALRLLMLLGPLGKAGGVANRLLTPLLRSGNLRFAVQVAGVDGPCTFQAVNNAIALTEGKNMFASKSLFVTVSDMAAGVGTRLSKLTKAASGEYQLGAWIDELVPFLRRAGMRVREAKGLTQVNEVAQVAQKETGPVIFAIRSTVRNAAGKTEEILHSVLASRTPMGAVRFADYGGKFVKTLEELVENLGYGKPVSIDLYQSGSSATVINGARITGEMAMKVFKGAFLVIEGLVAIETKENGVEFAAPAVFVASGAPQRESGTDQEVVKGSFMAYKSRQQGRPVLRMPEIAIQAGKKSAPRSDWLTGVQYRLNALGFGAGPVDGIMGPLTRKAVVAFQRTYPPLAVDGIPGPQTRARLVAICGY
jgi:Putative peptidoglycan binding domain